MLRVRVASDGAHFVVSCKQALRDGTALFTRGSCDDNCEFILRHVLIPFFRAQARGCQRDCHSPEKAGRTSMKIAVHNIATSRTTGRPLGAINTWNVRMLTITGANIASANGT